MLVFQKADGKADSTAIVNLRYWHVRNLSVNLICGAECLLLHISLGVLQTLQTIPTISHGYRVSYL